MLPALLRGRAALVRLAVCVALALVVLGAAACGSGGSGDSTSTSTAPSGGGDGKPEKTAIKVGVIPISGILQFYVAQDRGFFADEGLKVTANEMAGGAAIAPAVRAGQLDIGFSNPVSIVIADTKGLDFRLIAGGAFLGPGHRAQPLLVAKDSPIRSPSKLAGKTIAANTLANISGLSAKVYLKRVGVDPGSVHIVEVGFPDQLAALQSGRVDAIFSSEPFYTIGRQKGAVRVLAADPYSVFGREPLLGAWFSTDEWLEQNPNTASAFVRAIRRATGYIRRNGAKAAAILADSTSIPPDVVSKMVMPAFRADLTADDIEPYVSEAKATGMIAHGIAPASVLWTGAQG